jgi:hypothetical protein
MRWASLERLGRFEGRAQDAFGVGYSGCVWALLSFRISIRTPNVQVLEASRFAHAGCMRATG